MLETKPTFSTPADFFLGTHGALSATSVAVEALSLEISMVERLAPSAKPYMVSQERVVMQTCLDFDFVAGYKFGLEITYSCEPQSLLQGGDNLNIEDTVKNMQDGIFSVRGLIDANPYNHHLGDRVWMEIEEYEVARAAERTHFGSVWAGSKEYNVRLGDKDTHIALTTLTLALNGDGSYEGTVFTEDVLASLRATIKQKAIEYASRPFTHE